jgi:hypothetical protein
LPPALGRRAPPRCEPEAIESKVHRRRERLLRLLDEAWAQSAIPRDQDLADTRGVSLAILCRDVAALREL